MIGGTPLRMIHTEAPDIPLSGERHTDIRKRLPPNRNGVGVGVTQPRSRFRRLVRAAGGHERNLRIHGLSSYRVK